MKPQKWSVFSRKKVKPLHKYCVLLQLKRCLVPNLYLTLNCEIVFFERYHISVFFATELPYISVWRANGPFQILKSSANIKSRGLEEIKLWKKWNSVSSDNLEQSVVDKFTKLSQIGFSMKRLQLIFCNFLRKSVKIWLLGGRLGTCH